MNKSKKIAFLDDQGTVINIADFPDNCEVTKWNGFNTFDVPPNVNVDKGWKHSNGKFIAPPEPDK